MNEKKEPIILKPNPFYTGKTADNHLKPNPLYKAGVPTESKSPGPGPLMNTPQPSKGPHTRRPDPRRVNGLLVIILAAILAILLAFCGKAEKSVSTAPAAPVATTAPVEAPVAAPAQQEDDDNTFTAAPVSLSSLKMNLHKYDVISLISASAHTTTDYEGFIHKNCTHILCCAPDSGNCFGYDINGQYSTLSGKLYGFDESEPVCWLEIYGDGELLGVTDKVSEDNPSTTFQFSVAGVKQLRIVPICESNDSFSDNGWLIAEDLVLTP